MEHSIRRSHPKGLVPSPSPLLPTKKYKWPATFNKTLTKTRRFNGYRGKTKCCARFKSKTSESPNLSRRTSNYALRMHKCLLLALVSRS